MPNPISSQANHGKPFFGALPLICFLPFALLKVLPQKLARQGVFVLSGGQAGLTNSPDHCPSLGMPKVRALYRCSVLLP